MTDTPFPVEEATIRSMHAAMTAGRLTSRQLVQAYLDRIAAYDKQGPKLNAVIVVNPNALREADALDAACAKSGFIGPLHGIPVLLKDNVQTTDMPTTAGSTSLQGFVPRDDAAIVGRLRRAGAIVIAKTNLHEFAVRGETISSILGQTRNPYDLTRTPGGSSGGTGAGIAANFGAVGIGTDTVNSIRSPASANSLVGLRPTVGLVSRTGIVPYSLTQDTAGPIARTVEDAARLLDVLAGSDAGDPATAASAGHIPATYTAALRADGLTGARIGVLTSFFGSEPEHLEVSAVVRQGIEAMRGAGAAIVAVDEPLDANRLVADVSVHVYEFKDHLDRYLQAAGEPVTSLEEIVRSGKYHPGVDASLKEALGLSTQDPAYAQRMRKRAELQDTVLEIMGDARLDVLVFPHQRRLVVPVGQTQIERQGVLAAATGFPAIVVPGGFSRPTATARLGVPIGVEFVGRPWSEGTLLRIAYAFEQASTRADQPIT
jgi:amidase